MAAGAVIGAVLGAIAGWIGRDFALWVPTATAIGVGIGLVIEVGRGPQL
jgi:hypothetical protein